MTLIPAELSLKEGAKGIMPYIVSPDLHNAIKYAYYLRRPLLLRGEPGCGKTQFARVLAYQIYKDKSTDYRDKYFEWHVKSTSKAADGLYTFDYLGRLHDSQLKDMPLPPLEKYIEMGELGKAFENSKPEEPSVLLIDEIDKADIDFPNDLLLELDQKRFTVRETEKLIEAQEPPLIIITSNDEKELPNAFLRRCVFHYITFPDEPLLQDIVNAHMGRIYTDNDQAFSPEAVAAIVHEFKLLHDKMKNNPNTSKMVSTSELLDWVQIIYREQHAQENLTLVQPDGTLSYAGVLFKNLTDFNLFAKG